VFFRLKSINTKVSSDFLILKFFFEKTQKRL